MATAKYYGKQATVETLLELGSPVDPFTAAAIGDERSVLEALGRDPAIVRRFSADGWTLLHLASFFGQTNLIQPLLDAGSDVDARSQNSQGNTPLHAALPANHREVVQMLLAAGADVNARQIGGGYTPLHEAAIIGDLELAQLLIGHGADLSLDTDKGETALDLARTRGTPEMAAFLAGLCAA